MSRMCKLARRRALIPAVFISPGQSARPLAMRMTRMTASTIFICRPADRKNMPGSAASDPRSMRFLILAARMTILIAVEMPRNIFPMPFRSPRLTAARQITRAMLI
ncbi:hypothetical protein C2E23DRAFT_1838 [Lenzites betulinus]|nr:hypothetical protein C2E23DRAFT_1838 [Lenzites betulinus]